MILIFFLISYGVVLFCGGLLAVFFVMRRYLRKTLQDMAKEFATHEKAALERQREFLVGPFKKELVLPAADRLGKTLVRELGKESAQFLKRWYAMDVEADRELLETGEE